MLSRNDDMKKVVGSLISCDSLPTKVDEVFDQ